MNMPVPAFTMEQLTAELRERLPEVDAQGVRVAEMVEALGVGATTIRTLLTALKKAGRLRVVRRSMEALDGRRTPVAAYIIIDKQEEERYNDGELPDSPATA